MVTKAMAMTRPPNANFKHPDREIIVKVSRVCDCPASRSNRKAAFPYPAPPENTIDTPIELSPASMELLSY